MLTQPQKAFLVSLLHFLSSPFSSTLLLFPILLTITAANIRRSLPENVALIMSECEGRTEKKDGARIAET